MRGVEHMKKAIAIAVGVILVGVIAVLGIAATKPDTVHVERSLSMNASPAEIHPQINNYKNWMAWSPWEKQDPNMKRSFSGPESGVGAKYAWVGNDNVGTGDMTITSSEPEKITLDLHFVKPFEGTSKVTFTMVPQGDATKVTWAMDGDNAFPCKVMQVFMSMDDCCGKEFEKGLASLKTVSETSQTAKGKSAEEKAEEKTDEKKETANNG
jgi:hypothetical protein